MKLDDISSDYLVELISNDPDALLLVVNVNDWITNDQRQAIGQALIKKLGDRPHPPIVVLDRQIAIELLRAKSLLETEPDVTVAATGESDLG